MSQADDRATEAGRDQYRRSSGRYRRGSSAVSPPPERATAFADRWTWVNWVLVVGQIARAISVNTAEIRLTGGAWTPSS